MVASLSPWSSAEHLLKTASAQQLRLTVASFCKTTTSRSTWWMVIGSLQRMQVDRDFLGIDGWMGGGNIFNYGF